MATNKAKIGKKSSSEKGQKTVDAVSVTPKPIKKNAKKVITSKPEAKKSFFKTLFARKFDASENILTIFKDRKIIGAIIAEIIGTGLLTAFVLTLGLTNPLYTVFAYISITVCAFGISGAHLNPAITAGMLASRRCSAIRGTLYIIAQILGAWLGFLLINAFYHAGINAGNLDAASAALPALTPASDMKATTEGYSFFWVVTMIEFAGAIILALFFARALRNKGKHGGSLTFAATVAGGIFLVTLFAVLICNNFLGLAYDANGNQVNAFVFNPAVALMYGLFPTSAEGFGSLLSALCPMLVTYVVFPILGGILGFYLSDIASVCAEEKLED